MLSLRLLSAAALAGLALPALGQFSVTNPSYETGPALLGWTRVELGSNAVEGWTVDKGNIDHIGSFWAAHDGGKSIELNGDTAGRIFQVLATVPGVEYVVDFAMSGNWGGWAGMKSLRVTAGDESARFDVSTVGNTPSNMNWVEQQWSFTADGDRTVIRFASLNKYKWGATIDNVRITPMPIPAPAAGLALIGGLALARRRR